jgi:hypothetical protein
MESIKIRTKIQNSKQQEQIPIEGVLGLYQRVFNADYFEQLSKELGIKRGKTIFNWSALILGMILQRLSNKGTLYAALADLIPMLGQLSDHKRVREGTVSTNPGGFSRARKRLPISVVEKSFDYLFESLQNQSNVFNGRAACLLDGSTMTLEATPELLEAYPPANNQHGSSHWPILRVVVAHDLRTGLASRPVWDSKKISEQELANQLIARLPAGSIIVADSNFGIFVTAYQAFITGHPVVLRLTQKRALALAKQRLMNSGSDQLVVWKPSAHDCKRHPSLPADVQISGRLLVRRISIQDGKRVKLYLFTTCQEPAQEIFSLYYKRYNIETDLRALKRTVRLHALSSKTKGMVAKELVLGVASYNLVHVFMEAAAIKVGLNSRDLSFSQAQDHVYATLPDLIRATSPQEIKDRLQYILRYVAACKLPKRKKKRSFPRKVWQRSRSFPTYPTKRNS